MLGGFPVIGTLPWPAKTVPVHRIPNPANPGNRENPAPNRENPGNPAPVFSSLANPAEVFA